MDNNLLINFNTVGSYIYIIILTFICILSLYFSITTLKEYNSDKYYYIIYITIILSLYILFIGLYYFNWTFGNILYIILIISILFSFIVIIIFFLMDNICSTDATNTDLMKYFLGFLLCILFFLVMYDSVHTYTIGSTIKLMVELCILFFIYYIIKKKQYAYIKTLADLSMGIILFHEGMRLYYYSKIN